MDRLDTWLNGQRGWRRFAVAWLVSLPAGVALSLAWVAELNMFGPTTLGASAVLKRMALGVVASVPFAVLIFSIESLSRRRRSKRGKNRTPRYLWRAIVAIYILVADNAYSLFADAQPLQWRQQHGLFFAQIGLDAIAMALMIWNLQYWRRLQRRTALPRPESGLRVDSPPADCHNRGIRGAAHSLDVAPGSSKPVSQYAPSLG